MYQILIGGVDQSAHYKGKSFQVTDRAGSDRSTFKLRLDNPTVAPLEEQEVQVWESVLHRRPMPEAAGRVKRVRRKIIGRDPQTRQTKFYYEVECSSYDRDLERLTPISKIYYDQTNGFMFRDVASYALSSGFTLNNVTSLGRVQKYFELRHSPITKAFDRIAEDEGWLWWTDALRGIHFEDPYSQTPVLELNDDNWDSIAGMSLEVEPDTTDLANQIRLFYEGKYLDGTVNVFNNGLEVTVAGGQKWKDKIKPGARFRLKDVTDISYVIKEVKEDRIVLASPYGEANASNVEYVIEGVPRILQRTALESVEMMSAITGDSGVFHSNVEISNAYFTYQEAEAYVASLLKQRAYPKVNISFKTESIKLSSIPVAGQPVKFKLTDWGLDTTLQLSQVIKKCTGAEGPDGYPLYEIEMKFQVKLYDLSVQLRRKQEELRETQASAKENGVLEELISVFDRMMVTETKSGLTDIFLDYAPYVGGPSEKVYNSANWNLGVLSGSMFSHGTGNIKTVAPSLARSSVANDPYSGKPYSSGEARFITPMVTTTNLLTENQSSVETDTTGFTAIGTPSATISRSTAESYHGNSSVACVCNGLAGSQGVQVALPGSLTGTYAGSVRVKGPAGTGISVEMGGGGTVKNYTLTGGWDRLEAPAYAYVSGTVRLNIKTTAGQAITFYVDSLQVELNNHATGWVPGGVTLYQPDDGEDHFIEGTANVVLYSQNPENAYWTKDALDLSSNAGTAPDGTNTATKLIANTANDDHYLLRLNVATVGQPFTLSAHFKAGEYSAVRLGVGGSTRRVDFNAATQAFSNVGVGVSSYGYKALGNGWYRVWVSYTSVASGETYPTILLMSGGSIVFAGDGSSGMYIWGIQGEQKPYPTAYQPTERNALTRFNRATGYTPSTMNLLSANQSSVETNTTGFGSNNSSIARITTDAWNGSACMQVTSTNSGATGFHVAPSGSRLPVVAGQVYSFSVYVKRKLGSSSPMIARFEWFTANTGSEISRTYGAITETVIDEWVRLTVTGTAPATANYAVAVITYQNAAIGEVFLADGLQVEQNNFPTPWILGGTTRYGQGETRALMLEEGTSNLYNEGGNTTDVEVLTDSVDGVSTTVYRLDASTNAGFEDLQSYMYTVTDTDTYTITFKAKWAFRLSGIGITGTTNDMRCYNASVVQIGLATVTTIRNPTPSASMYQEYEIRVTFPAGTVYCEFFRWYYNTASDEICWLTKPQLEKKEYSTSWVAPGVTRASEVFAIPTEGIVDAQQGKFRACFRTPNQAAPTFDRFLLDFGNGTGNFGMWSEVNDAGAIYLKVGTGSSVVFQRTPSVIVPNKRHTLEITWALNSISLALDGETPNTLALTNAAVFGATMYLGSRNAANTQHLNAIFEWVEFENAFGKVYRLDFSGGTSKVVTPEYTWTGPWEIQHSKNEGKTATLTATVIGDSYVIPEWRSSDMKSDLAPWYQDITEVPEAKYIQGRLRFKQQDDTLVEVSELKYSPNKSLFKFGRSTWAPALDVIDTQSDWEDRTDG